MDKLTRKEKKILSCALESGSSDRITVPEIAEDAGCSTSYIYDKLQDEEFKQIFVESLKTSVAAEAPAILKKFAQLGKEGEYQHGKLILEVAGIYNNEANLNIKGNITTDTPFKDENERSEFLAATMKKYVGEDNDS